MSAPLPTLGELERDRAARGRTGEAIVSVAIAILASLFLLFVVAPLLGLVGS